MSSFPTGEGSGDDEVITVNLSAIPDSVTQQLVCKLKATADEHCSGKSLAAHPIRMVFSVNIYTPNITFDRVSNAYCRVCSQDPEQSWPCSGFNLETN